MKTAIFAAFMTAIESLKKTLTLIQLERAADLEYYRQKVLLRSLHQRTQEGTTWYPVVLKRDYIGTGERLVIEVERTNHLEQPHAFQSGKSVSVFSNATGKPERDHVNGVVNYVRDSQMVITLNSEDLPDWLEDGLLGIDVMFDEMSYREMEFALREVMRADENRVAELRELLLGNAPPTLRSPFNVPVESTAGLLNASQQAALAKAVHAPDIAFIHGPPGTGKTTTLVAAINQVAKTERQVLVCAPSNAAVDLLVEKLSEQGLLVTRVGHPARVTEQSISKTLDARISGHPDYHELRNLRKRMEQLKAQAFKFKRNFGHHEREQRRLLKEESRLMKADADLLEFHIINEVLNQSHAICATLVGASHPVLRGRTYKTVFIDEAAQALEPACWIPLLRAQRVIFAGDHQQLPPTIKSNEAAREGLAQTLFEKGIARLTGQASMLEMQYRMHEDIMAFSSSYFYEGRLTAHESVAHARLRPDHEPILFIDTAGCGYQEKQDPETLSRFNEEEAQLLIGQIERLVEDIGVANWQEQSITLAVITPYRAQVEYLETLVETSAVLAPLLQLITVNTVDAFQGQERDVVAISLVRSNEKGEVGFLGDIRRTNVAMTRARKKLMITGDSATLGAHPFYLALVDYVQAKGYYKSAFEIQAIG